MLDITVKVFEIADFCIWVVQRPESALAAVRDLVSIPGAGCVFLKHTAVLCSRAALSVAIVVFMCAEPL
jgi:hypothetical protein